MIFDQYVSLVPNATFINPRAGLMAADCGSMDNAEMICGVSKWSDEDQREFEREIERFRLYCEFHEKRNGATHA